MALCFAHIGAWRGSNYMKIVVIDGQGGRLGKLLVEGVKARLPQAEVWALGTNSIATATMLKAGADEAATGENPVVVCCRKADLIVGPIGIVIADALLGEITPKMSRHGPGRGRLPGQKVFGAHEQLRRGDRRGPGAAPAGLCRPGGGAAGKS